MFRLNAHRLTQPRSQALAGNEVEADPLHKLSYLILLVHVYIFVYPGSRGLFLLFPLRRGEENKPLVESGN